MAGIDKTYVSSWEDYCRVLNWCFNNEFTCPNGTVIRFYPYEWEEKSFKDGNKLPVLNTSYTEDYFLIKHCPLEVVQNRMHEVYDEGYITRVKNGTSGFDTFVRPEKISKIKLIKKPLFYNPSKYFWKYKRKYIRDKYSVSVTLPENWDGYAWYNEHNEQWLLPNELGGWTTSHATLKCKSWKALIRKIMTWHLPKGTIINVCHFRLTGGACKFIVK